MESIVAIQRWLYGGIATGLGDVAGGNTYAIAVAMAAAVLFGAVHALMPGHGKTVLVSYHLGQPAKLREGVVNGTILVLTHVGLALVLVLAGFAVISKAFAYGGRTPHFEAASGVLIALVGLYLIWRSLRSDDHSHAKDGKTLALVTGLIPCPLTTFIMSYALARGMLAAGLVVTAAMTVGMIATIGGIALAAVFARNRFLGILARTESWRHRAGTALEVGGSVMVLVFGLWIVLRSLAT
jgi:ABC-type nickel/cobalt efflux system permease component RcnA